MRKRMEGAMLNKDLSVSEQINLDFVIDIESKSLVPGIFFK